MNPQCRRGNHDIKDNISVPYTNTRVRKRQ